MIDYFLSRFNSFSLQTCGLTPENFSSRIKRKFFHSPNSKTLIITAPGWGQSLIKWSRVKSWAEKSDCSILLYEFPRAILSDNHTLTAETFGLINQIAREDIGKLKNEYKFEKCLLIGISLGSSFGSMIYKGNSNITDIVLVCPGNNLALNMWNGCRTKHLRKSYEKQGIDSLKLNEYWKNLASENNMPAPGTNITILYGKYDEVIPYYQSKNLAKVLQSNGLDVNTKNYCSGHYLLILYFLISPGKFLNKHVN